MNKYYGVIKMASHRFIALLIISQLLLYSGCATKQNSSQPPITAAQESESSTVEAEASNDQKIPSETDADPVSPAEDRISFHLPSLDALLCDTRYQEIASVNWFHLTAEQKADDFDTLYQTLKENSPYINTLKRMTGTDISTYYNEMRPLVMESASDAQSVILIQCFLISTTH